MALDAIGSDGAALELDSAPTVLAYNGDNTLNTITIIWAGSTYVQTLTYTLGKLTGVSAWVKQ